MGSEIINAEEWREFIDWIYRKKDVMPNSWLPNKTSIELWREYQEDNTKK